VGCVGMGGWLGHPCATCSMPRFVGKSHGFDGRVRSVWDSMSCKEVVGVHGWVGLYRVARGCQNVVGTTGGEGAVGGCCGL
jgi:hypothetical protein